MKVSDRFVGLALKAVSVAAKQRDMMNYAAGGQRR